MEKALDARAPPLVYPECKHIMHAGSCLTTPASPPLNPHPAIAPSPPAVLQYIQGTTTVDFTIPTGRHNKEREHNHTFFRSRPPSIAGINPPDLGASPALGLEMCARWLHLHAHCQPAPRRFVSTARPPLKLAVNISHDPYSM
ncbi:hypothetical protein FIBSPDRAFT_959264 [Athelia psychrophila]|uniref:Uncharacterized protein n=1 Tax=Athelia psychrophila TaxID=1759441 RepID=A0A166DQS3_9AGAM|nr:hypothetical protein FIBSPDRAFT_959264 [Fibularhizoctonia sp. CBS 109695]